MIFWGWMRRPTLLGSKMDQCPHCGHVGPHFLLRSSYWVHLFWVPIILFRVRHGVACANCGEKVDIRFLQMRRAFRSGALSLPNRVRRDWPAIQAEIWSESGKRPSESEFFDPITANPHRGFFDLYLKAWPILVTALLVFALMLPKQFAQVTGQPEQYGARHTCWADSANGDLTGCRFTDGIIHGRTASVTLTCYFDEALADFKALCR